MKKEPADPNRQALFERFYKALQKSFIATYWYESFNYASSFSTQLTAAPSEALPTLWRRAALPLSDHMRAARKCLKPLICIFGKNRDIFSFSFNFLSPCPGNSDILGRVRQRFRVQPRKLAALFLPAVRFFVCSRALRTPAGSANAFSPG